MTPTFSLTVKISKCGLILSARKCLPCRYLSAQSRHGTTAAGCEICTGLTVIATEQRQ